LQNKLHYAAIVIVKRNGKRTGMQKSALDHIGAVISQKTDGAPHVQLHKSSHI